MIDIFELGKTIKCHKIVFNICPDLWTDANHILSKLKHKKVKEIKFLNRTGTKLNSQVNSLPLNGGVYFFIVKASSLPDTANYLLYIGRAKKTNSHNLKIRCKKYFTKYNNEKERPKISRMIDAYGKFLYLNYFDLGEDNDLISDLEKRLINNLIPPFNDFIPEKTIRDAVKAFP